MKKTRLPLLALAAFAFSAHAADWFDAEIAGYTTWPTNPPAGEWTGTEGATLDAANHALAIDAPMGTTVAFEPTASKDVADEQVVFNMTATLSAVQPLASLRPLEADKKGSLAAATDGSATNYYGWAKDPAGTTNTWLALTGATPAVGTPLAVRVLAKAANRDFYVQYEVGGVALAAGSETWLPVAAADTTLGHAGMRGRNFAVSSLSGATEAYPPETATLTIGAPPTNVTLVSVTADGVPAEGVEGVYTVADGATVVATFAPAPGYRLVGNATVSVVMDADKTLSTADMPTAEPIPVFSLTLPELPANVSLVSVTTNGVAVEAVEGAYPVYDGAEVVVTFAAADGYVLSPAATVSVVVDGDKTLDGIPTALSIASLIKINEIMASNPSVDKGGIASEKGIAEMDWIELYNGAPVDVDLTGWHLSDNAKPGKEDKATILGSCVIPAKGYKIVWLDKIHVDPSEYAADEAFAVLKLSSSGEFLQLADPSKAVVQQVDFSTKKQIKGVSYGPLSVPSEAGLVPGNGPFVYMKTATPGAPNVTEGFGDFTPAVAFSEPHGYKTAAFDLELSCPDAPAAQIYYTLDGTSPTTASILYTNAIPVSKTTVVRAAVPVENTILQFDTSATYIFLDDVLAQARSTTAPASAVGFPNDNAVNNQEMLYGMEQSIVTGGDRDRLLRGFTNSIATLSIVVDPANLFNSTTGIYVNPRGEGETWERQIMLEGFDPTGVGADFAQPAGLRLRGGNSRNTGKPKHSLRFFFRSSYGESSLAAKMFVGEPLSLNGEGKMKEEIGEYDKLDLRTSQNLSWANENSGNDTFVTEVFSRDSQRDLGQPYTRSRYYNLFINGQYWGLYQTQERGDEHWGEAYLGGDSLQYDLIKTASTYVNNKLSYSIECNEGTWDAWEQLFHIAVDEGFEGDYTNNYNRVLGLNPDGTRNPAYPVLLNAESLMVYMLVSHYVVDQDGPTSPFSSIDKGHPNNFYAIRNRDDAGAVKGFVFLRHDAEMSMGQNGNTGASQNPTLWGTEAQTSPTVGSPDPTGLGKLKFRTIPYFTPAELHYLLMQNPVYKRQYADLFYRECLREGGAMTVENATARYTSRMAEIDDAIVCEAARWGKSKNRSTWKIACKTSTTFITNRLANMKSHYQAAEWYPTVLPPYVTDADGVRYFDGGEVPYQKKVYLQNNEADGTLYYTIDGTDPADSGIEYTAPFSIPDSGATVRARLFKDNEWSPLEEVALEADVPNDQRRYVRIAAIRSHAAIDPDEEFIVITNTFDQAVSLEGLSVWSEKTGQNLVELAAFGEGASIDAGGTVTLTYDDWLLGSDGKKLKLKNGAIDVELRDYNGKVVQFAQIDTATWYPTEEFNDKGKRIFACGGTGRWLIALDFRGAMEGVVLNNPGDVNDPDNPAEGKQWTASPKAPSTVTLTVPAVANATVSATTNGVALAGADDGNGNTVFTIEPGTVVAVTYTAAEGYHVAGSANDVTTAVYEVSAADTAADYALAVDAAMAINVYTVAFVWHGGSFEDTYEHGTAAADVVVPRNPPSYVDGATLHVFTGWSAEVPATITEDIAIEAQYSSVDISAAVWVGGDAGDWDNASKWDIGCVPTSATVVTFTNDAQVAIDADRDHCKKMVLDAGVTIVPAGSEETHLIFWGDDGVATSGTGTLAADNVSFFNANSSGALTIGTGLSLTNKVMFKGNQSGGVAGSFTVTGNTTVADGAEAWSIDEATTTFEGPVTVPAGATATFYAHTGGKVVFASACTNTLVAGTGDPATTLVLRRDNLIDSTITADDSRIVTDSADYYVRKTASGTTTTTYRVAARPTVYVEANNGVTVTGVVDEQRVVPGTNLSIGVSGFAEGWEPSVTITKRAGSVLLATNAASFVYEMPNEDIVVSATAVQIAQVYYDPEGRLIEDSGVVSWLSTNGFTQAQIDALGNNAAGTDRLYECWLFNLDFRVQDADAALRFTDIAVSNKVSMTVQLVRKAPLAGRINGALYIYGADNLAAGFSRSPIPDESVEYFTGDPTFNLATSTDDTVTQTAVATLNDSVTAKFFKATIEVPWVDNGEDFEPEEP